MIQLVSEGHSIRAATAVSEYQSIKVSKSENSDTLTLGHSDTVKLW